MTLITDSQNVANSSFQYRTTEATRSQEASPATQESLDSKKSYAQHGWEEFTQKVDSDPELAKELAKSVAFIPDKLMVNLNEAPLSDPIAFKNWAQKSVEFDKIAAEVTQQRIDIYNDMKADGSSDAEIFNGLMAFNHTLPVDYQLKSALIKVDTYA